MDMAASSALSRSYRRGVDPRLVLLACALAAALVQGLFIPIDADVSWLITVAERVLAGKRLYVDVFEVNPPASVWLYLPMVWLAKLTGLRPEAVVAGTAIGAALLSSLATLRLAARLRHAPPLTMLAAVLGFTTLILPGGLFAQREHFAALLALPAFAALALLAERRPLSRSTAVAVGIAAGLVIAIKPHFLLAFLPAALWAALRSRSLRPLLPGIAAAAVVLAVYAVCALLFARGYFDYLPLLAGTYLHMRESWPLLLAGPCVAVPGGLLVLAAILRPARVPPLAAALLLGMTGFAVAAVIQGKGYANHALPGSVLGFTAILVLLASRTVVPDGRRLAAIAALLLAATQFYANARIQPQPGLADAVRRVAPPRPTMITLGTELVTGHPAVRNVDGRWVGSRASLFTAAGVQYRRPQAMAPAERARLERWYREDILSFATDVAATRPDVVLVEVPEKHWITREPVLVSAMRDYRFAARAGKVEIWLRR